VAIEAVEAGYQAQSILTNGFGIIAFMSVTPLIAVQILGICAMRGKTEELVVNLSEK